jgi:hypothetical protein
MLSLELQQSLIAEAPQVFLPVSGRASAYFCDDLVDFAGLRPAS